MKFRNVISGPIFCADAPDVVIETADAADIDVRLSISGFVWQFALSPVAEQSGYVVTIKTRDILEALIEPSSIGSGGVSGVPVVEISAGADTESSISMSFQALYGSAAGKTPADMARHWLTWRDQISTTYFGCRERLTFFAGLDLLGWKSGSYTVAVKIYTPSGIVQATLASGTIPSQVSYISVDASPASVLAVGEVSSILAYDLSFSLSGTAADDTAATVESYPLRLVLGAADPRAKEFIFINSLGVEDRVTACGIRKDGLEGGSSKFVNGGVEREHGNEAQEQFEVYSGHLATARSVEQWMEFLKSSERYLSSGGLKGIVIDDYNTEVQEGELCSVSFTYRLSERIKGFHHDDSESIGEYDPTQKYGALVVGDVPDATTPAAEDLFFLKTRLDEFPLVSLSEDYLLLVQSPVSYHWGAVSLDSVKNWIQKTIDHNGISLAAVWASLSKTVPDTYANELISEDHIPTLPQAKVTGLPDALSSLRAGYTGISVLIPQAATADNQLADKEFVNSSIATATATFRGTFVTLSALEATPADRNDYAFWAHKDEAGNTCYDKYTYTGSEWKFEYRLNNSSFTAAQWGAVNSGITGTLVTKLSGIAEGAQVNVIETVKLGGTALAVSGKAVDITGGGIKSALGISDWALAASKPSYTTKEVTENTNLYFTDARAKSALSGHTGDTTIHITAAERTAWNAKWDWNEAAVKAVKVNAAGSADKLANSRKLWGNAFNGTADVDGDITLGSGRRIYFGSTSYYIELVNDNIHTNVGLYSDKFISARGSDPDAGGGSGASLPVVWASLQGNTDDYKDKTIHQAHIPTLPVSRIDGLATALAGKQAAISDLDTIRTNAATAFGWGDHSKAGYITLTNNTGQIYTNTVIDASALDANTWYPVLLKLSPFGPLFHIEVTNALNTNVPSWATHRNGFTCKKVWEIYGSGLGAVPLSIIRRTIYESLYAYCDVDPVRGIGQFSNSSNDVVFVRGGGKYIFACSRGVVPTLITTSTTISNQTIAPTTTAPVEIVRNNQLTTDSIAWDRLTGKPTTLVGYGITDASRIFRYTIPASGDKGVRITFTANEPVKITVSGSNQHAQLVLVGTGYGEGGFVRNNFTELVHSDSGYSWCMPDEACSVEVFSTRIASDWVTVESPSPVAFTAISALSTSAVNRRLLTAANYSSYALPLTGGTMTKDAAISWGVNDRTDWDTYVSGIRVMSSITANSGAPVQYATGISVMARYSFQIAAQGGDVDAFFIRAGNRDWKKLLHEGNYSSFALPLTGGTIRGSIRMDGTTLNPLLIRNFRSTDISGCWARSVLECRVDDKNAFRIAPFGDYTPGAANNKMNYVSLGFADYGGLNLRISETDIKWGNSAIYHAGNCNNIDVSWSCHTINSLCVSSPYNPVFDANNPDRWLNSNYGSSDKDYSNMPDGWKYGTVLTLGQQSYRGVNGDLNAQFVWDVQHGGAINNPGRLWWRTKNSINGWKNWQEIYHSGNANKSDVDWACKSLTAAGDISTAGWYKATNGLYGTNGVYFRQVGSIGEISIKNNNEFCWGCSTTTLHFNFREATNGKTVLNYIWNAGSSTSYATHTMGSLTVLGTAYATTGIYSDGYVSARGQDTSSDIRLKTDFRPLDGALEYIRGTHFTRFRWRDGGESVGIIAQEERGREYGFLVRSHGEIGHLTYDYAASTALLGAALQEEDEKVEALKKRVKELENELNKLKHHANR